MALKKAITLNNGVVVNYHRIQSIGFNKYGRANCLILQYVSQEIREKDEKAFASELNMGIKVDDGDISYKIAYEKLKETDYFKGAEDC